MRHMSILAVSFCALCGTAAGGSDLLVSEGFDQLLAAGGPAGAYGLDQATAYAKSQPGYDAAFVVGNPGNAYYRGEVLTTADAGEVWGEVGGVTAAYRYDGSPFFERDISMSAWEGYHERMHVDLWDLGEYRNTSDGGATSAPLWNHHKTTRWQPLTVAPRWGKNAIYNVGIGGYSGADGVTGRTNAVTGQTQLVGGPDGSGYFRSGLSNPAQTPLDDRDAGDSTDRALGYYIADEGCMVYLQWTGLNTAAARAGGASVFGWKIEYDVSLASCRANGRSGKIAAEVMGGSYNGPNECNEASTWFNVGADIADDAAADAGLDTLGWATAPLTRHVSGIVQQTVCVGDQLVLRFDGSSTQTSQASDGTTRRYTAAGTFRQLGFAIDNVILTALWSGDADGDGLVTFDDMYSLMVAGKFETGLPATWAEGDFNNDGLFNFDDLQMILDEGRYENGTSASTAALAEWADALSATTTAPEPGGCVLLCMAAQLLRRRRGGRN